MGRFGSDASKILQNAAHPLGRGDATYMKFVHGQDMGLDSRELLEPLYSENPPSIIEPPVAEPTFRSPMRICSGHQILPSQDMWRHIMLTPNPGRLRVGEGDVKYRPSRPPNLPGQLQRNPRIQNSTMAIIPKTHQVSFKCRMCGCRCRPRSGPGPRWGGSRMKWRFAGGLDFRG